MRPSRSFAALLTIAASSAPMLAPAGAQEAAPASETSVVLFNSLVFLLCGMIAMLMIAGLAMIEAGVVRTKNAASGAMRKLAGTAVAILAGWLVGHNLAYGVEPGGFLGVAALWSPNDVDPVASGRAAGARFVFDAACAAIAVAIVSGALAERLTLRAFIAFAALAAGIVFPIAASWAWGGGFLETDWKFHDFAGATIIHGVGGSAALAGALIVGARRGRFQGGRVHAAPAGNPPLAVIGAFFVWFGWFALIAGAQRSFGAIGDAVAIAGAVVNANVAAAGGALGAIIMTSMINRRADLALVIAGLVGGLVSISADPISPAIWQAALIGAFGGVIVVAGASLLERARIDDAVGAIPAHLFCGVWGTLVVAWTSSEASILGQLIGAAAIVGFSFAMSGMAFVVLKYSIGVRVSPEKEMQGLDQVELVIAGLPAPEPKR